MKKSFLCIFAATLAAGPSSYAQGAEGSIVPVISNPGGPGGRIYTGGPGTYRQVEEDVAEIAEGIVSRAQLAQTEDRDYVLGAVNEIHNAFVEYSEALISDKLLKMETDGVRGDTVSLEEFMQAIADIKAKHIAFTSLMTKNASINKDTLPSNYTVNATANGDQQQVPLAGKVELGEVIAHYNKLISEKLEPQLKSYQNIKVDINGVPVGIAQYKSLLNPDFSALPDFSPEKLAELTQQMKDFRKRSQDAGMAERLAFTDEFRNLYNAFFEKYGADYTYVYRQDDREESGGWFNLNTLFGSALFGSGKDQTRTGKGGAKSVDGVVVHSDITQRDEAFDRIINVLWMRSYARLVNGVQICAAQPKDVEATNFKGFQSLEAMVELRTEPACTTEELELALENTRRILISSGVQADHVFDSKTGFLEAGLVNKLGSAVTFARGKRSSAEALHMLAQLVYADIQEDLIMATPGRGLRELRSMYAARYQNTPEKKETYTGLRCAIDQDESCGEVGVWDQDSGVGMSDDFKSLFYDLRDKNALALDYIGQAERIQATLDAARSSNDKHGRAKARKQEL